jgi:hypothetical protein
MHVITPRLFSKDIYSLPLRALRLRGCVRLDRGGEGEGVVTKMFPDVQKIFRTYNNFPKIQMFSKIFTFSCPENYLNSPENLLQIYLNLPKSALEIYLKFLMSNYQGCGTTPDNLDCVLVHLFSSIVLSC